MSLDVGTRLGPYEIVAMLGAGGMGEVYKAKDTRLDRSVAIKVLPREVSADPDRRARFEREAKTIAQLSHPHICPLFDVGEAVLTDPESLALGSSPVSYLVMEHLTGETLAQRLEKGPLPLPQALEVGAQIADGLAAAHRQGVVHRDLKPANVMLTKAGAKLLDFGLAKLKAHGEQAAALLASAPTERTPLTAEGHIVGTLPYMAPEQLEGKAADARTDLWALGAILYEMVTGKRAFEGASAASLIGAILEREPPALSSLQPVTPPALDRLVKRCLVKDPDARWESAHDAAEELRWLTQAPPEAQAEPGAQRRWRLLVGLLWAVSLVAIAVLGVVVRDELARAGWVAAPGAAARAVAHLEKRLPADAPYAIDPWSYPPSLALSPDGSTIAYSCSRGSRFEICLQRLDRTGASPVAGTEGGRFPAFSPDGQWVAYESDESGTFNVYVRAYPGGGQCTPVSVDGGHDAVWSADGRELFFRNGDGFYAVPVELAPTFKAGTAYLLFRGLYFDPGSLGKGYDVTRDGQRFLVIQISEEERAPRRLHLVQNFFEEVKAKVPHK